MEIDIDRLKVIQSNAWLYAISDDLGFGGLEGIYNEKVIEYESIQKDVIKYLIEKFNKETEQIFLSINLKDFEIDDVKKELEAFGNQLWNKRNNIEIQRDQLLEISYSFYTNQCKNVKKFKELELININRLELKEQIKKELTDYFRLKYLMEIKEHKISTLFFTNHWRFYKEESIKHFNERNKNTIERDAFGLFKKEDYETTLTLGFLAAVNESQFHVRINISEQIRAFIKRNIEAQKPPKYYYHLDFELYDYVSELFKNRTTKIILEENNLLIDFDTYQEWSKTISKEIKSEYLIDNGVDDNINFGEQDYEYDIPNSGYEKYGGYNGYDDDSIDSAFEGDPENTWNVD